MDPVECDRCCTPFGSWRTYMVHDHVWRGEAGLPQYGFILCIPCLGAVLRRSLTLADFTNYPCNDWLHARGTSVVDLPKCRILKEAP